MDMTEKNGHPSMEEILASIRRIVAEEPEAAVPLAPHNGPVIDFRHNPITLNRDGILDDSEFDLPAIFRSSTTPPPEKPGPLIGRLTDALRNATGNQPEQKQMQTSDENSDRHVDNVHNGHNEHNGRPGTPSDSYSALSSLQPVRTDGSRGDAPDVRKYEPAQPQAHPMKPSQAWGFTRAAAPPAALSDDIKRVMVPFKDTHFLRMSGAPAEAPVAETNLRPAPIPAGPVEVPKAAPPSVEDAGRAADPASFAPERSNRRLVPELERDNRLRVAPPPAVAQPRPEVHHEPIAAEAMTPFAGIAAAAASTASSMYAEVALRPVGPVVTHDLVAHEVVSHEVVTHEVVTYEQASLSPPPLTAVAFDAAGPCTPPALPAEMEQPVGTIEDTTAELLRPMLRQWLADNMPRMVEKALHIEVAESVKPGKKPAGP